MKKTFMNFFLNCGDLFFCIPINQLDGFPPPAISVPLHLDNTEDTMLPVCSQRIFCAVVSPQHLADIRGGGTRTSPMSPLLARSMASLRGGGVAGEPQMWSSDVCVCRILSARTKLGATLSDSVFFSLGLSSVCMCCFCFCLPPGESLQAL